MKKGINNNSRLRRIVYTLNNPTDEEIKNIKQLQDVRAQTFGRETGAGGTYHLQGAILFTRAINFSTLKTRLPRAHIERMNGTPLQAFEYCWKEDSTPYKFGDLPKPGKRNDLKVAVSKLQEDASIDDLCKTEDATVVVKFHKGLQFLVNSLNSSKPLNSKRIIWLYGPTGIGKTQTSVDFAVNNGISYWINNQDLKWFDGYNGQEVAIFDDFRWKHCSFSFLLRLLDRYELNVPIKGAFVRWNPKIIFITTPLTVDETFKTDWRRSEDLKQIHRRITYEWDMTRGNPDIILASLKEHCKSSLNCSEELIRNPTETSMKRIEPPVVDLTEEPGSEEERLWQSIPSINEPMSAEDPSCFACGFAVCVCSDSESDIFQVPPQTDEEFENRFF